MFQCKFFRHPYYRMILNVTVFYALHTLSIKKCIHQRNQYIFYCHQRSYVTRWDYTLHRTAHREPSLELSYSVNEMHDGNKIRIARMFTTTRSSIRCKFKRNLNARNLDSERFGSRLNSTMWILINGILQFNVTIAQYNCSRIVSFTHELIDYKLLTTNNAEFFNVKNGAKIYKYHNSNGDKSKNSWTRSCIPLTR